MFNLFFYLFHVLNNHNFHYYYVNTAQPDGSFSVTKPISTQVPYQEYLKTGRTEPKGSTATYRVPYSADKGLDKQTKQGGRHDEALR